MITKNEEIQKSKQGEMLAGSSAGKHRTT